MTNIRAKKIIFFLLTALCLCSLAIGILLIPSQIVQAEEANHGVNTPVAWTLSAFGSTDSVGITTDVDDVDALGGKVAYKAVINSSSQTTGVKITFAQPVDLSSYAHVFVRWKNFNQTNIAEGTVRVGVDAEPVEGSQAYPYQSPNSSIKSSMLYYQNYFSYDIKDMIATGVTSVSSLYIGVVDGAISEGQVELYIDHIDFLEEGLSLTNVVGVTNNSSNKTYDVSSTDAYSNAKVLATNNQNSMSAWQGWDVDIYSGEYVFVGQFGVNSQTGKEAERALTLNFGNLDLRNYSNVIIRMKNYNSSKKPDGTNPYFSTNTTVTVKIDGTKQTFSDSKSGGIPFVDPNLNGQYANTTIEKIYGTWYQYDLLTQSTNCPQNLNQLTLCRANAVSGGLDADRGILMLIESIEFVPVLTQKVDTIKLGRQYTLNELVSLSNTVVGTEDNVGLEGYLNSSEQSGDFHELGRLSSGSIAVTESNYDTVNKTYSICVSATNIDLKGKQTGYYVFTYKVDESLAISSAELPLIVGVETDIASLFNIEGLAESFEYKVDGQANASGKFTAQAEGTYAVYCKVTNSDGSAESTAQVEAINVGLLPEITDEFEKSAKEYFADPALPFANVVYTTKLYKQADDVATATPLTIESSYVFTESGNYKLIYEIYVVDIDRTITYTTNYNVTLVEQKPTITLDRELDSTYYSGYLLELPIAMASNSYQSYTVTTTVSNGNDVAISEGKVTLATAGNYTVTFTVNYDTGKTVVETLNFVVIEDTVAPEIFVSGSYGEKYDAGLQIDIFSAIVTDNSGVELSLEIKVFKGKNQIDVQGNKLTLDDGTYSIIYSTTDYAGHKTEKTFNFTVGTGVNDDANGQLPTWAIVLICVGAVAVVAGSVVTVLIVRKRRQKHD